jgi:3-oxoadipate enol-lactonase
MIPHHRINGPDGAAALLMGPSLGTHLGIWDGQLPLSDTIRLVRYDHRGHGGSPAPPGPYEISDLARDVLELMDHLGLERASFCGLSIGGMVGMWLAAEVPERVERLTVICTSAYMPPPSAWRRRADAVRRAGSAEPIADPVVEKWLTPDYAVAHPEVRADLRGMLVAASADGYAWCCEAIERMDLRPKLPAIAAPTLVVSGSEDLAAPVDMQREIARAIPGARHEIVGPAAHQAVVEQPDAINDLIREHMH